MSAGPICWLWQARISEIHPLAACRLCERQTPSGGLNGRPQKLQDVGDVLLSLPRLPPSLPTWRHFPLRPHCCAPSWGAHPCTVSTPRAQAVLLPCALVDPAWEAGPHAPGLSCLGAGQSRQHG